MFLIIRVMGSCLLRFPEKSNYLLLLGKRMNWADRIREIRFSENLKQDVLAAQLGVSQGLVSQWERGAAVPKPAMQALIEERFGLSQRQLTLRAQRLSVQRCPNIAGLLRVKEGEVWLDALSAFTDMDSFLVNSKDVGTNIQGKLGELIDQQYEQLRDVGAFDGENILGIGRFIAERDGRQLFGETCYATVVLAPGESVVRVDSRVSTRSVDRETAVKYDALEIIAR